MLQNTITMVAQGATKWNQPHPAWLMMLRLPFHLIYRMLLSRFYCTLRLSDSQVAKLPQVNRQATLEMRQLIGRKTHTFSLATSTQSVFSALDWQPRPSDVIVLTPPRSGTTWCARATRMLGSTMTVLP